MNSWLSTCVPTAKSQEIEVEMMYPVRGICLKAEYHWKPRKGATKGKIYLNPISYISRKITSLFSVPLCLTLTSLLAEHGCIVLFCSENRALVGILLIVVLHNYFFICDAVQSFLSGSVRSAFSKI